MLELAILGLLKEQDHHGYELKKRLSTTLSPLSRVSFGSLYPALNRLERAGAIRAVDMAVASVPIPATGSLGGELAAFRARRGVSRGGRSRKVYCITDAGNELFSELVAAEGNASDDDRTFNLKLAFARYLSNDARLGMFERRRAHLVDRLSRSRSALQSGRENADRYTQWLMEHSTEATERDISWLDRLIASERDGATNPANTTDTATTRLTQTTLEGTA